MALSIDKALGIHDSALILRSHRAGLLGENIANANTPNYKARDVDFRAALRAEVAPGVAWRGLVTTHPRHQRSPGLGPGGVVPGYRVPTQPTIDGNTVDAHVEKTAYATNAIRYQASLTFLGGKLQTLRNALNPEA